jgi:hypothetical protein
MSELPSLDSESMLLREVLEHLAKSNILGFVMIPPEFTDVWEDSAVDPARVGRAALALHRATNEGYPPEEYELGFPLSFRTTDKDDNLFEWAEETHKLTPADAQLLLESLPGHILDMTNSPSDED